MFDKGWLVKASSFFVAKIASMFSMTDWRWPMGMQFIIASVVAVFVVAYLVYSLIHPEKF